MVKHEVGVAVPDAALATSLFQQLEAGEEILWMQQPSPARFFWKALLLRFSAVPVTLFFLFWESFAVLIAVAVLVKAPWVLLFPLAGIFILGMAVTFFRSPQRAKMGAAQTIYAITNRRALVVRVMSRAVRTRAWARGTISVVERHDLADGLGDIVIGSPLPCYWPWAKDRWSMSHFVWGMTGREGFFGITDAKKVEGMLRQSVGQPGRQCP